jgi:hypothetical protein
MNVEIGTEAAQFPEKDYVNRILIAVHCNSVLSLHLFFLYGMSPVLPDSAMQFPIIAVLTLYLLSQARYGLSDFEIQYLNFFFRKHIVNFCTTISANAGHATFFLKTSRLDDMSNNRKG